MFTKNDLVKLRKQVVLCSLFTDDFENDMGIEPHICQDFFDGYAEYLGELMKNDGIKLDSYDTADNLYNWYLMPENPFGDGDSNG